MLLQGLTRSANPALPRPPSPPDPVFGCELSHLCERDKSNVPKFLLQFMEHIEKKGLNSVGLYRLSGNAASVQKLRCIVEQGEGGG